MANFVPPSVDENGDPIDAEEKPHYDEKGHFVKGHKTLYDGKKFDSEQFKKLFDLYNTIGKNGKRMITKACFARELGVSVPTLTTHLKSLNRDGRLDKIFYDDAVMQIKTHEKEDTPENILARMGIMN